MGALGKSAGKRFILFAPTIEFATHHQIEVVACQPGDAARKGKVCDDRADAASGWSDSGQSVTVVSFVRSVGQFRCCVMTRTGRTALT